MSVGFCFTIVFNDGIKYYEHNLVGPNEETARIWITTMNEGRRSFKSVKQDKLFNVYVPFFSIIRLSLQQKNKALYLQWLLFLYYGVLRLLDQAFFRATKKNSDTLNFKETFKLLNILLPIKISETYAKQLFDVRIFRFYLFLWDLTNCFLKLNTKSLSLLLTTN